ncbi:HNH endonuclease [Bacillus sp. AFS040349]|uniref:HNH endonuclease n=1 Tax=Bacillus sp. AFS040349 TaxID=2033502 RepID=UPI0020FFFCEC|nr:HNH endonuclease [Bacillus sp. AFS040349]
MSWVKIERHIKIKQYNSPFDASLKEYFEQRDRKEFDKENTLAKQKLAKKSKYKCRVCRESLVGDEPLEANHIVPKIIGGRDTYENLNYFISPVINNIMHYWRDTVTVSNYQRFNLS